MSHHRRRVLCAEPHEDTCSLLTTLLEQHGHEVIPAKSVRECLDLARMNRFDLYMLDDDYMDGSGLELCKRLRAATPETPILFFSAQAFLRDRQRAMEAGAHSYFIKPGDIFEVVAAINSILAPRAARARSREAERP
ncbi:MAG TPA: response regulator [Pyrinomonadaceae bacterium]|nr:response regulator [Pyrinomonadaceae bacterium]